MTYYFSSVAQSGYEQESYKLLVGGSNPSTAIYHVRLLGDADARRNG